MAPLRQRNSGSARSHNISVAVEEDVTVFVVCKLSSKLVVRLTIHGDQDRRLEVGPWSLDVVAYVVAVLLRRESGCRLMGIDSKTRALDVLMIYDFLTVSVRDVVAARVVRNFDDFSEEHVRLLLARAYWSRKSSTCVLAQIGLLGPSKLPLTGAPQAEALVEKSSRKRA
jgi:hypothetical protein